MAWMGTLIDFDTTQGTIFWTVIALLLPLAVLFALYWFTLRKYRIYLMREYGYKINGWPTFFGIACFLSLVFTAGWAVEKPLLVHLLDQFFYLPDWLTNITIGFNWDTFKAAFFLATPWVIIGTIIGLVKIKNVPLTALNILVLYGYVIIGGLAVIYIGILALALFGVLAMLGGGLSSGVGGSEKTYRCTQCGAVIYHQGRCSNCE